MKKVLRFFPIVCAILILLCFNSVRAENDTTLFWDSTNDGKSWYAWSEGWYYVKTAGVSGVDVNSFEWDGNTCNVVLDSSTYKDASFAFNITCYTRSDSGGITINGEKFAGSSASVIVQLEEGTASVATNPYVSTRTGETKTFSFTIDGGGIDPSYSISFVNGEGYEISTAEGYSQTVSSHGTFSFTVNILEDYKKGQRFKVLANETELTVGENGTYTITDIKKNQTITVEDVVPADTVFSWDVIFPENPIGYYIVPVENYTSPVRETEDFKFTVNIADGYGKNAFFAVKANGMELTPDANDIYTIENITSHQTITVEGAQVIFDVALNNGTGYTVSPVSGYTSPVFSGSEYKFTVQIENGFKKGADFEVISNGTPLTADSEDVYTISNIQENHEVTVVDVVREDTVLEYRITFLETDGVTIVPAEGFTSPVVQGADYKFTVTLAHDFLKGSNFSVKANDAELTEDENGVYTISNVQDHQTITVTGTIHSTIVTAPTGSTVCAGTLSSYYNYTWADPVQETDNGDGTTSFFFMPFSGTSFYRVQHPDGVTYWDFQSMAAGKTYTVTMEEMTKNGTFYSDTYYHDFYYNYLDLADVYLNVNERNYLALSAGETRELDVFRNWQAIESFTNAKIAIPDAHYEVTDINGNPSDLVTVTPDTHNSCLATISASSSATGMAIIKVTYDAMIHTQGYSSGYGAGGADTTRFSAIWPECTGVIVVTVKEDGSAINLGMTINIGRHAGKVAGDNIDAEHDLLYYFDNEGAEYTFKPESGATVYIARCTLDSRSLSFNGFTTEGITIDEEGNVTVTGLTAGRHIVKVEKDGMANYQVLSARYVKLEILNAYGNVVSSDTPFEPGETLKLVLHNVNSPQEKLASCYNNSFSVAYYGEDKPEEQLQSTTVAHGYGQYNFTSQNQEITVKIPDNWDQDTFSVVNGTIMMGGFSGCATGGHRAKAYNIAQSTATGTPGKGALGQFPDIVLNIHTHNWNFTGFTWTGDAENGYTAAVANYTCSTGDTHSSSSAALVPTSVVTNPSCDTDGFTTYRVTIAAESSLDGENHSDDKTALTIPGGHIWKLDEFSWTGDEDYGYTAAVAHLVCENDSGHLQDVTAELENIPDPDDDSRIIFTATAEYQGETYTDVKYQYLRLVTYEYVYLPADGAPGRPDNWPDNIYLAVGDIVPIEDSPSMDGYLFDGWNPAKPFTVSENDNTVTGTFRKLFTISYYVDGELYTEPQTIAYGKAITPLATPKKEGYTFSGWSEILETMPAENLVINGSFTVNKYMIRFVNDDGAELQSSNVAYGEIPVYTGKTPTKTATAQYTYDFSGWDKKIGAVTGDTTYTATYSVTVNEYTVRFINDDGTELQNSKVAYGKLPAYTGNTPSKPKDDKYIYEFSGWTPDINVVTGDVTYTAVYAYKEKSCYKVVEGENSVYEQDKDSSVTFVFKRLENDEVSFDHFIGVKYAGELLTRGKDYTVAKGSVIIKLQPEFLKTLSDGSLTLTACFDDGNDVDVHMTVVIAKEENSTENELESSTETTTESSAESTTESSTQATESSTQATESSAQVTTESSAESTREPDQGSKGAATGDNAPVGLWVSLMLISLLGILILQRVRRKRCS